MKHESYFNDFLRDHINLNPSRLDMLEKRVVTVTGLLEEKLEGYRKYSEQGSYAHKTIIKPVQDNDEFDADLLIFIRDDNFDPRRFHDYVDRIHKALKDDGNYRDKVDKKTRCVTIDYAGDFHLDLVPCIEYYDTHYICNHYICNRRDERYEKTDGDGYKDWLVEKSKTIGGNHFRKVVRLLKFLRDHKGNFSAKSILLTTLLGNLVSETDINSEDFSDVPTALKTLLNRLNDFLQRHENMPPVKNPVMSEENFDRHWDQAKYSNFRDKISTNNGRVNEAYSEGDHNRSVKKWRELFGEDFGELKNEPPSSGNANNTSPRRIVPPTVPATKPYADVQPPASTLNMIPYNATNMIQYSATEFQRVQKVFPDLHYESENNCITGKLKFKSRYQKKLRKNGKNSWAIEPCLSGSDCFNGCYEISISFGENPTGLPKVFETGGRIEKLAKEMGKPIIDLHVYPSDNSCCLGVYIPTSITLYDFIVGHVYPYFVWQAYFDKYRKVPPCGEHSHGESGIIEYLQDWYEYLQDIKKIGRNDPCFCGSGKKYKKCCLF